MVRTFVLGVFIFAVLAVGTGAMHKGDSVQVATMGGYHVGGGEVALKGLPVVEKALTQGGPVRKIDPNGEFEAGEMYVQFVKLANPKARYPLMLWHGGGLAGSTWENTPDGREGWQMYFLRQGHDVYVSDAVERGRASWARYPEINPSEPVFRSKKDAWVAFRFGDDYGDIAARKPYEGLRFPVKDFDRFMKGSIPRWSTSNDWILAAYKEYVSDFPDGCVIVAHSQAAFFALSVAIAHPDKVKGLVIFEGSGAPKATPEQLAAIKHIPQLHVWGDFIDKSPLWQRYMGAVKTFADASRTAGADVTWLDLPEAGIRGNSHMLYLDDNGDEIAGLVQKWMQDKGLMR